MKRLLNTLYITKNDTYLARDATNILVRFENETLLRLPIHTLCSIVCFGRVGTSPPCMQLCCENGVNIVYLSEYGKFIARLEGPTSGNVLLRVEQARRSQVESESALIARPIIISKIINSRAVLMRATRDRNNSSRLQLSEAAKQLNSIVNKVSASSRLDEIRGFEGEAARIYFEVFDHLIITQKNSFVFQKRSRRPPLDPINALLSFVYTLLANDVKSALETVGLDPQIGFLHRLRPGRPSLALDLMEELRAPLADRLVLSLINLQQVKGTSFIINQDGEVVMNEDTRKLVLAAWQNRKRDEIRHPFLDENINIGLIPHAQALLLARYLRGDIDAYPPMIWK